MMRKNNSGAITRFASFFSVCLLLVVSTSAASRDLRSGNPSREGMSAERLEKVAAHMNARVDKGIMVGGQGMIARNGRIVYNQTYGMADREQGRSMEEDAIYRIYSMTKPITAVALMMLYEEGHFFLNDPIAMYIPELADLKVAVSTADAQAGAISDGTISTGGRCR